MLRNDMPPVAGRAALLRRRSVTLQKNILLPVATTAAHSAALPVKGEFLFSSITRQGY